ncbi:hypothetical protein BP00DRAFT_359024 [Aspergillus indologenus CBS 114.80]|uniref:Uncharacterized protein n=1 Tax=Aspergillus indologenus CBS 114.80 TaxID=1450541 RepID=A0A2V5I9N8_9EURO|nr:hypothetical protein BP00DRAFT_359024 [Aspergillus indologenus CBS 114.80]
MRYSNPVALWLASLVTARAQQFSQYSNDWSSLNLTQACFSALNTTVSSCPSFLARTTTGFAFSIPPNHPG